MTLYWGILFLTIKRYCAWISSRVALGFPLIFLTGIFMARLKTERNTEEATRKHGKAANGRQHHL